MFYQNESGAGWPEPPQDHERHSFLIKNVSGLTRRHPTGGTVPHTDSAAATEVVSNALYCCPAQTPR